MTDPREISSLWAATARPCVDTPPLAGECRVDAAVIGGGFTGLTAALALAEGGASVVLLEAEEIGFGASGRNGGQVIPGLKYDPDKLDRIFGEETTDFVGRTADVVFDLIDRHSIDCTPVRNGWLQASLKHAHLPMLRSRMEQWRRRGVSADFLGAGAMKQATGSEVFAGGWIDRRAGTIHPLNYVRGLAAAATKAGARLCDRSRVVTLARNGTRWQAETAAGHVLADSVVLATNGYTDRLWPRLKASVLPANSFQVATEPLTDEERSIVLPGGVAVSDTRRIGNYFRTSPDGRLVMGGRGSFRDPRSLSDFARIVEALHRFYPETSDKRLDHAWSGRVAMTADFLPHLHRPAPGLIAALGYNGRGVAMASALGTAIGKNLLQPAARLPLTLTDIRTMPVHDLHAWYGSAMIAYYRLRDRMER